MSINVERCSDNNKISREIMLRQSLASLADNFSAPYMGYYLAALSGSGVLQGILQFSVNSMPTTAQVFLGPVIDRVGRYIVFLLTTSVAASILWIIISLIIDPVALVGVYTLRAVVVGLAGLAFTSFIGVFFVDANLRSRVLSLVTLLSQATALLAFLIVAFIINPSIDQLRIIFIFSGVISLAGSLIWIRLLYIDNCMKRSQSIPSVWRVFKEIIRNKTFIKFDLAFSGYIFVMSFAWPYFPVAQRNLYKMSVAELAILNILGTLSTMIFQYILMKIIPRTSLKKLIIISRLGFLIPPFAYAFSPNIEMIYLSNILVGPFSAIGNVVITLYVYEVSVKNLQATHLAFLNFSQGIAAAIGSILGGVLMDRFVASYGVDGLRIGFIISTILRGVMTIPFIKTEDVRIRR